MIETDERVRTLIDEATRLRYSRRGVIKRGAVLGVSTAGITAALGASGHRVSAKSAARLQTSGKLTVLAGSYFVPEAQDFFVQQVADWGTQNNVEVQADFVNWPDIQAKISAAVESGAGPDVVELRETWPYLYYEQMVDLNEMATRIGEAGGGFYEWATNTAAVDGNYYSIPVGTSSVAFAYRISHLRDANIASPEDAANFPQTWEELFALGKILKTNGHPIGQALGHSTGDPPGFAYAYMWAYGAMELAEDGTTVAFNNDQFVSGMETFIQAWKDGYDETGLSWDDSANNRSFLSDQISVTMNGSSIYLTAQKNAEGIDPGTDYEVIASPDDINHAGLPAGPAGRFNALGSWSYGVMKYSQNQEAAAALLEWWLSPENYTAWLQAQKGYIIPATPNYASDPVFTTDPKLAPYLDVVNYGRNKGYAGPANQQAARVSSQYIITDTFAKAIQTGDAKAAIEEGARLLERIYSR